MKFVIFFTIIYFCSCIQKKDIDCFSLIEKLAKKDDNIIQTSSGRIAFVFHSIYPPRTTLYLIDETTKFDESIFYFAVKSNIYNKKLVGARDEVFKLQAYGPELSEVKPLSDESKLEEISLYEKTPGYAMTKGLLYIYFFEKLSQGKYKLSKDEKVDVTSCLEEPFKKHSGHQKYLKGLL